MWIVQCAVHYCKFIWWTKLSITHNFREPFMAKSLDQNCSLLGIKTKCNFAPSPQMPHFVVHIKFPEFSGGNTREPRCGRGRPPAAPTSTPVWPPTFKYLPKSAMIDDGMGQTYIGHFCEDFGQYFLKIPGNPAFNSCMKLFHLSSCPHYTPTGDKRHFANVKAKQSKVVSTMCRP